MTAAEKIEKYLEKRGVETKPKLKVKRKASDITTAAKEKELLITIASDLGYIQ